MNTFLTNPLFMVVKAMLACALALYLNRLLGNPDHVSATFVAILCLTPTVRMGLKNARAQLLSGLLGACWGTWLHLSAHPPEIILPLAVGLAIGSSFALKMGEGYATAAFSALFVILVQFQSPWHTLGVRFVSLSIAAASSFFVNALVSALIYRDIFSERLQKVEQRLYAVLPEVLAGNGAAADQVFELLAQLKAQMRETLKELAFRRAWKTHAQVSRLLIRAQWLNYLLHLIWDLAWLQREEHLDATETEAFVRWIQGQEKTFIYLPDQLLGIQKRIVAVLAHLAQNETHTTV
jgi:uncharacterized membrane protein YgaE (UPF0421/DUF939 family)